MVDVYTSIFFYEKISLYFGINILIMSLIFFWSIVTYGITSIVVCGTIFEKPREWIKTKNEFVGELISCTLCTSTWVGFILSFFLHIIGISTLSVEILKVEIWIPAIFLDGMFTAGMVWIINSLVEFFEESRIK